MIPIINNSPEDSNKVMALNYLSTELVEINLDTSIILSNQSLSIAKKINWPKGIAISLNTLANLELHKGNYPPSLGLFIESLKIYQTLNDPNGIATVLANIGNLYLSQDKNDHALKYYQEALDIVKKTKDKKLESSILLSIGTLYNGKKNYSLSLKYFQKAIKIAEELKNEKYKAIILSNIGNVYQNMGDYANSTYFYKKSLEYAEKTGNKYGMSINYTNIGDNYYKTGDWLKAEYYAKLALNIDEEMGALDEMKSDVKQLFYIYDTLSKNFSSSPIKRLEYAQLAINYLKKYIEIQNTISSEKNIEEHTRLETKFEMEKEQIKKDAIAKEEAKKKTIIIYTVSTMLLLLIVFLFFIFRSLKITREQKNIIQKQKYLVEEKNKEITDSITYAKRIQNSILPSHNEWVKKFPNSFILYLPKDIVAGDFYWLEENENYVFLAVADCTGHGVPGAMVSITCSNALTKTISEEHLQNTDEILNRVREIISLSFNKADNDVTVIQDGMDICLIRIDKGNSLNIQYSGANRPLWILNNQSKLIEYLPDKQPIGYYEKSSPFCAHNIVLNKHDKLYLFTDGYADQFGGTKQKKLGTKNFKNIIQNIGLENIINQGNLLTDILKKWQMDSFQVDDITIIGIEFC